MSDPRSMPLALVVGASRGLGLLVADDLAERGHRVVLASRSQESLDRARERLVRHGRPAEALSSVVMDVSDRDQVADAVAQVEREHGPLDVVIHVAGIIEVGPAENTRPEHIERALAIMAWGPINLTQAVLPGMRERGAGRIGVVTSVGGLLSAPHLLAYSTAKFAAVGYTEGLAASLSGTGVTATVIAPGLMRTGSHVAAEFFGDRRREYAWFAPAASMPLVSMDATTAAHRMVTGVLEGKPYVILTPAAKIGARVRGLMPATTTRVMGLVNRMLPGPVDGATEPRPGSELAPHAGRVVTALTTLGDRASKHNLEPGA